MAFDIKTFKETIRDTLRVCLHPICLHGTIEVKLSDTVNYEIAQSFIPFSKCYSTIVPYKYTIPVSLKIKRDGTPDSGLIVSIQTNSSDVPSGSTVSSSSIPVSSISTDLDIISTNIVLNTDTKDLGSKTRYWMVITPKNTASTINYFSIARHDIDSRYLIGSASKRTIGSSWSTLATDLYFDIDIPDWIYTNYPHDRLKLFFYPRICVDIVSRPRIEHKYVDRRLAMYHLTCAITIYSRYPDEISKILSYVDRILWKERTNLENIEICNPGNFTDIIPVRERLFSQVVSYDLKFKMTDE